MKTFAIVIGIACICAIPLTTDPAWSQSGHSGCCFEGRCLTVTEEECDLMGGMYLGTDCFQQTCPTPAGTFVLPLGIAADMMGHIFVSDAGADYIQKFTTDGVFLLGWGLRGSGDGQFRLPIAIASGPGGNVYVLEGDSNYRVQKFSNDGVFLLKWGSFGPGDGQFENPRGIGVDAMGYVYVTDSNSLGQRRVQKFNGDGSFVGKWGGPGTGDGEFMRPWDVACDAFGNLFVSDFVIHEYCSILKFDSAFNFIRRWSSHSCGVAFSQMGLATDAAGNLYAVDRHYNRIQKFDNDGNLITMWGGDGIHDGQLKSPEDVTVDENGFVYVADARNRRIQKFTSDGAFVTKWGDSVPTPTETTTWGGIKALIR